MKAKLLKHFIPSMLACLVVVFECTGQCRATIETDTVVCAAEWVELDASGLDTSGNGKRGTYAWYDISSASPNPVFLGTDSLLVIQMQESRTVVLQLIEIDGTDTCISTDTASIRVIEIPKIDRNHMVSVSKAVVPPYPFCESNNGVVLKASPAGGSWESDFALAVKSDSFFANRSPLGTPIWIKYVYNDSFGCAGRDSVRVQVYGAAEVRFLTNDTAFCQYEDMSIQLEVAIQNTIPASVTWIVPFRDPQVIFGGLSRRITLPWSGDTIRRYTVIAHVTDPYDVCDPGEDDFQVTVYPRPDTPLVIRSGDVLICPVDSGTYEWYVDGNLIAGANKDTLRLTQTGTYRVYVISKYGCDATSPDFEVKTLDLMDFDLAGIRIFPNPANKHIVVDWPGHTVVFKKLVLIDPLGRTVLSKEPGDDGERTEIAVGDLSSGLYQVVIDTDNGRFESRLFIR